MHGRYQWEVKVLARAKDPVLEVRPRNTCKELRLKVTSFALSVCIVILQLTDGSTEEAFTVRAHTLVVGHTRRDRNGLEHKTMNSH